MPSLINDKTKYILININYLIFSIHTIFAKLASEHSFLSPKYLMYYAGALTCLMTHALLWQQTLKYFPLIKAYSWKGVIFIWAFIWSVFLFDEVIKWTNIVGSLIIIAGVLLVMKNDAKTVDGIENGDDVNNTTNIKSNQMFTESIEVNPKNNDDDVTGVNNTTNIKPNQIFNKSIEVNPKSDDDDDVTDDTKITNIKPNKNAGRK